MSSSDQVTQTVILPESCYPELVSGLFQDLKGKDFIPCLMGPTASGKSDLALQIAEQQNGEIISVDSAQVYRGMDIGTAKPTQEILKKIPHHLIDIRDPKEPYSAEDFRRDAMMAIKEVLSKNKMPLLVGGTMLYFKALQQGLSRLPSADKAFRERIIQEAEINGWDVMHEQLRAIDSEAAKRIHAHDTQRVLRALEIYEITGQTMTALWQANQAQASSYQFINMMILPEDRSELHQKIERRFDRMLDQGFVAEVKRLYARGDLHRNLPSMRAVGYRQVWDYLEGKMDFSTMREKAIIATRQLAKHQLTWLRA